MNGGYFMGRSTGGFLEALFWIFLKWGQKRERQDDQKRMLAEGWQKAQSTYADAFLRHLGAKQDVRHYPVHLQALAKETANADPKYHFYGVATVMLDGVGPIDQAPPKTRVRLSLLALSVLTEDAEYARWYGLASPDLQDVCDKLRADWQGKAALAQAAQRRLHAGMADWRANRNRWTKARFLPMPQGLSAWLMTQPPQVWHVWAKSLQDGPKLTRDLATAIRTVADHPACNHATALRLLVTLFSVWEETNEPLAAAIAARLERQDLTGPGFALADHEWTFANDLLNPDIFGLSLSPAALRLRGDAPAVAEQPFEEGYPYQPYPEWCQQQGQPGT
jgi:hypothetical protein